jgi:ribonuclease HI
MSNSNSIIVYCDGACLGNQYDHNNGGWGTVIIENEAVTELSGYEPNTTNQRMELTACIKSLEILKDRKEPIEINSDSAYLINCMNEKWHTKWLKNGWKTSNKKQVENKDLWLMLLKFIYANNKISFRKATGHSNDKWNERADFLAKEAANSQNNFKSNCL